LPPPDRSSEPEDVATFEETYSELQRVTQELQAGGLTLEVTLELYQRGVALAARCQRMIRRAELRVTRLSEADGPGEGDQGENGAPAF
jgi:exodeoxyribonuclease VII small subunit